MKLVGLLRRQGELTATRAGELIGESSGTASYHLRQLAKYGLVEEAGGGQGREKPWRATALFTHIAEDPTSPAGRRAASQLWGILAGAYHEWLLDWLARRPDESRRWRAAAPIGDHMLYVTADELASLDKQIVELLNPYAERLAQPELRPRASRLVRYVRFGAPS